MPFSIIEQFSCGKVKNGYSEDRIIHSRHHFGILDGSRGPHYSGSEVITAMLDDARAFIESMPFDISLPKLVAELTGLALEHKREAGFTDYRTSGGFVFGLYSEHFGEIWRVGDCKFRNNGLENAVFWESEEICARARALKLNALLQTGLDVDAIMARADYDHLIDDLLVDEASFLNRPDNPLSFGAINGQQVPECYLERFPARAGRLVITSDGYPKVFASLDQCEQELARLLVIDPLCIAENLQCKGLGPDRLSFDDRSLISADIQS
nr:hypothetical protein [uncultured Cohaesibacter sp.]